MILIFLRYSGRNVEEIIKAQRQAVKETESEEKKKKKRRHLLHQLFVNRVHQEILEMNF
ncbi:WSSV413 [White spot syndrome virus]|uniref:WSSV413 n=1 Tax=White spot syndrome virus TaxID=342409 RepID=A0A2I6SCA5_9VIRU|nr:WSSV413 [White spot syndrome virus]